jgi:ribosomal protein S18 acetylase RimI-like enzyme
MTDLLGVCTAWDAESCVVQPETGPPVRILLADVVSGKPVPPRPPTRFRASPDEAQRRAATLFPGLATETLGGWTLRSSSVYAARRANSVLAMHPSGLDPQAAYARVLAHYEDLGKRPVAAVLRDTDEEQLFLAHGWVPESDDADTVFEMAGLVRARRSLPRSLQGQGHGQAEAELLEDGDLATVRIGDRALGVAAVDGDWVGYRGIEVAPEHRGQGLGLAVMAALMEWSAERGAATAYLQVLGGNARALRLYDGLGFEPHHVYRYLAAPAPYASGGGVQTTESEGV